MAELGCLWVFGPTQGPEATEYASIIAKTEASGLPASSVDSARLATLEGISGHSYLPVLVSLHLFHACALW